MSERLGDDDLHAYVDGLLDQAERDRYRAFHTAAFLRAFRV